VGRPARIAALLVGCAALAGAWAWPAAGAPASTPAALATGIVTLEDVVALVERRTDTTVEWDARLERAECYVTEPVIIGDASLVPWLMSVCEQMGLGATVDPREPGTIHIASARRCNRLPMRTFDGAAALTGDTPLPDREEYCTLVWRPRRLEAGRLARACRTLVDPNAGGRLLDAGGALTATGFAPNLQRILTILDHADRHVPDGR